MKNKKTKKGTLAAQNTKTRRSKPRKSKTKSAGNDAKPGGLRLSVAGNTVVTGG
jgi:hypothetical protein